MQLKRCYFYERYLPDGQTTKEHVKEQLRKGRNCIENGKSIAIGHVGIEGGKITAQAIQEMLPEFDKKIYSWYLFRNWRINIQFENYLNA